MCGGLIGFSVVDAILFRSIVYIPCHFPSYFTHFSIGLRSIIKWICRLLFFVFIIPNFKKKILRITNYKFLYQNTQLCVFYSSIQTSGKYWLILILWLILKSCITKFSILPKIYKITSFSFVNTQQYSPADLICIRFFNYFMFFLLFLVSQNTTQNSTRSLF